MQHSDTSHESIQNNHLYRSQNSLSPHGAKKTGAINDTVILGTFSTNDENDTDIVEMATTALVDTTGDMLTKIVQFAALRCRRDHLWNLLFTNLPSSSEAAGKEKKESRGSAARPSAKAQ